VAEKEQTFTLAYVQELRKEAAGYRDKYKREREKNKAMDGLQQKADAGDELQGRYDALVGNLRESNLLGSLRTELASLGVADAAKQDIVIKATRADLAVEWGDDHKPSGDFADILKSTVDTLGIVPAEPEPAAPRAPATPEPITVTPRGPKTMEQRNAQAQAALNASRAGKPPG
jgi:hypothetical protein